MKPRVSHQIAAVCILITAATLAVGWRQHAELTVLRARVAALTPTPEAAQTLREVERRNRALEAQIAALQKRIRDDAEPAAAAADARSGPGTAATKGGPRDWPATPQAEVLRSLQQRGALDARYAALFRQLNLAPEHLERFKALLAERQATLMDVMRVAREQGLDPFENRTAIRALLAEAQAGVDGGIRSLLGDAAFAEFEAFEQTAPQRTVVSQLEQRLSYTDAPLTSTQSEQLMQILAATSPTEDASLPVGFGYGRGGGAGPGPGGRGPPPPAAPITPEAILQAQTVLSPQQLGAFQQLQQEQQAQQQLMRTVGDPKATPPPTGGGRGASGPGGG
jgi:hypothetical protein